MVGSMSTAILTVTRSLTAAATAVWVYATKSWVQLGLLGWRLPWQPIRVTATVLVAFGWRFWVSGLGFGQTVAGGLLFMGCRMHCRGWPAYVGGLAPVLGGIGAPRGTIILVVSSLFLWRVCTLQGCLLPNLNPFFPYERLTAQTRSIFPYRTLGREGTTFAFVCTQKLCFWSDLPHICGSGPQWEIATVSLPVTAIAIHYHELNELTKSLGVRKHKSRWNWDRRLGVPVQSITMHTHQMRDTFIHTTKRWVIQTLCCMM